MEGKGRQRLSKRELRHLVKKRLLHKPAEEREQCSKAVIKNLQGHIELAKMQPIGLYAALPGEVSLAALLPQLKKGALAWPRVKSLPEGEMGFYLAALDELLKIPPWGILEPPRDAEEIPMGDLALVLVPGLAFTREGGRLGRGKGFYDRCIARARQGSETQDPPLFLGLAFECQLFESLPMEAHDQWLDGIVTENACYFAKQKERR